jgi:hypothetical protein
MPIGSSVFSASPASRAPNAGRNPNASGPSTALVHASARTASRAPDSSTTIANPQPTRATPATT